MHVIRAIFRQYWSHLTAIAVFAVAARRYWLLGNFMDETHILCIASAATGLLLVLVGNEWTAEPLADPERFTRDTASTRRSFTYRSENGPILGMIILVGATIALHCL